MKQLRLSLSVILGVITTIISPVSAFADNARVQIPELVVSEIKIKNDTSTDGYNEFIELYNLSESNLNLNQFSIEYHNSPAPPADGEPVKKVVIADKLLMSGHTVVLAANQDQIPGSLALPFSSLSDTGGLVRIKGTDGLLQDEVSWTSTAALADPPILFLSTSTTNRPKSFIRSSDDQGVPEPVDPTWELLAPTPHSDELLPVPLSEPDMEPETPVEAEQEPTNEQPNQENDQPTPTDTESSPPANETAAVAPLQISELLPNPAPPANESNDEFIELYNPNNETVDLNGYKLQTGTTYGYTYTFSEGTLGPHEYRAFYVSETNTLLANSGGRARLLGSAGQIIYETDVYGEAKEGSAWAYVSGTQGQRWQWTTSATPDGANVLTLPLIKAVANKSTASKTAAKPKAAAKKTTATKKSTKSAAKTKAPKASPVAGVSDNEDSETTVNSVHPGIVAGVGALALGYCLWEYRHDIRNRLYQFSRYRASRRASGPIA